MHLGIRNTINRLYLSLAGPIEARYLTNLAKQRTRQRPVDFPAPEWFLGKEEGNTYLQSLPQIEQQGILAEAQRIIQGDFSILGCPLDSWDRPRLFSTDLHNGYQWPLEFHSRVNRLPGDHTDIKIPWELSQFQFLPVLGQAYWLSGNEKIAVFATNLISKWMSENPYLFGANWSCPMKASMRACNWLWAWYFFGDSSAWTQEFSDKFWQSLWLHAIYIERNLEDWGLFRQNHYLGDIVGLLTIGIMCPWFPEADQWKQIGLQELDRCMQEQVYPDGVDFENSTSYHRLAVEFFASSAILCRNNQIELPTAFWDHLKKMFDFTLAYTRPDSYTPLLGDNDDGRLYIFSNFTNWEPGDQHYLLDLGAALFQDSKYKLAARTFSPEAWWLTGQKGCTIFENLATTSTEPASEAFPQAGIYFLRSKDVYVMVSAAKPGINGAGTHQHNDALNFELCVGQQPVLVDSGTYCYSGDEEARNKYRSTLSHNTIQVDGEDQSLPGDLFSVTTAGKAQITIHQWETGNTSDNLVASHDGYTRLPSPVTHRRSFHLDKVKNLLTVTDNIIGTAAHSLTIRFHMAKGLAIQQFPQSPMKWKGMWGPVRVTLQTSVPAEMNCGVSNFSPSYFVSYERPMVELRSQTGINGFTGIWIFEFPTEKV